MQQGWGVVVEHSFLSSVFPTSLRGFTLIEGEN